MARTVQDVVNQTKMLLEAAKAQTKAAEITGTPPSEIPGAENDKPAPQEALKSDPQVADGSMGPASAYNEGGKEQKNEPVGELFEADQPVLNPEKKPEESADANAKVASDVLGNSILADIKAIQTKMASEKQAQVCTISVTDKPEVSADANADAKDEDKGPKEEVKADTCVGATPPEKDDEVNKDEGPAKEASDRDEMQLTTELLAKLACYMLAEEEGAELGEKVLAKIAGADAARDTMDYLAKQAEAAEAQAAYEAGLADAEQWIARAAFEKGAQDVEAAMADAAGDATGAEGGDEDGVTPEEFIGALDALVQSGQISPEQAQEAVAAAGLDEGAGAEAGAEGGDEELQVQELAQKIEDAIASGAIKPEEAEELVQELSGDADPEVLDALEGLIGGEGEGGAEPAEAPVEAAAETPAEPTVPAAPAEGATPEAPEAPVGDAAPAAAVNPEELAKAASVKKANLLNIIGRIGKAKAKK